MCAGRIFLAKDANLLQADNEDRSDCLVAEASLRLRWAHMSEGACGPNNGDVQDPTQSQIAIYLFSAFITALKGQHVLGEVYRRFYCPKFCYTATCQGHKAKISDR